MIRSRVCGRVGNGRSGRARRSRPPARAGGGGPRRRRPRRLLPNRAAVASRSCAGVARRRTSSPQRWKWPSPRQRSPNRRRRRLKRSRRPQRRRLGRRPLQLAAVPDHPARRPQKHRHSPSPLRRVRMSVASRRSRRPLPRYAPRLRCLRRRRAARRRHAQRRPGRTGSVRARWFPGRLARDLPPDRRPRSLGRLHLPHRAPAPVCPAAGRKSGAASARKGSVARWTMKP